VSRAKELGATIVIGDLKGIRRKSRGRTLNRIVNRMPYHRLTQYIKYKAEWESIPVLAVPEFHSPETCHRCGEEGKRISQGLLNCPPPRLGIQRRFEWSHKLCGVASRL